MYTFLFRPKSAEPKRASSKREEPYAATVHEAVVEAISLWGRDKFIEDDGDAGNDVISPELVKAKYTAGIRKHLYGEIKKTGARGRFRSLTESIDTNTSSGKLVFHIFGALAEFERSIIRERTRAGLAAARSRGRTGGRPLALDEKGKAAGLALLRDPSIPVKEIAHHLGISVATLYYHFPGDRGAVLENANNSN